MPVGNAALAGELGLGVVLLDAGKIVFDADGDVVFDAGPHQVFNEDFTEFCAAFAS